MALLSEQLVAHSKWVERSSGRTIVVLNPDYQDGCVSWYYESEGPERGRHYCDALDFVVWQRFLPVNGDA